MSIIQPRGLSASQVRKIPLRQSLMRSWLPNAHDSLVVNAFTHSLYSQWGLDSDFDMIRLVFSNYTATPYAIPVCKISPSAQVGDGTTPINGSGVADYTMFVPVTFNNAGLDVLPQDQTAWGSGPTTFTVPAGNGNAARPSYFFSDWIRLSSLPLSDGSVNPLLMVRTLTDAAGTFRYAWMSNGMPASAWALNAQGRVLYGAQQQGVDRITAPSSTGALAHQGVVFPFGVQYMARVPGFSVLAVGDSLTQGGYSPTNYHPWGYLSCLALSTPLRPISFWNNGLSGSVEIDFWAAGYAAFKACKPDVVTIPVWTPNDPFTQASADADFSMAMDFANYADKNGAVPVFMGPLPWGGIATALQDAPRLTARSRMLQAAAGGRAVLDWEPVITTGASPNRILPQYLIGGDGIDHPGPAGYAFMDSAVFRPVLANILRA
jgi:hypothetical protein